MKHTPTPWAVNKAGNFVIDDFGYDIAICPNSGARVDEQTKANADFIVRACNAHEAFVEILRAFLTAYDAGHVELNSPELDGQEDIPPHPWHEEWLHLARAALAKAEGR